MNETLMRLLEDARKDVKLKKMLIDTKSSDEPVRDFCLLCQSLGYNISIGELMSLGQDMNDSKLRSVNGGGVDGIDGWDDAYEMFFCSLL